MSEEAIKETHTVGQGSAGEGAGYESNSTAWKMSL